MQSQISKKKRYLKNLLNIGGLLNRKELVNSVHGKDDEFSKILIGKVQKNGFINKFYCCSIFKIRSFESISKSS